MVNTTIKSLKEDFSFCEICKDKNGKRVFVMLPNNTLRLRKASLDDLQQDDKLKTYNDYLEESMIWTTPCDFTDGLLNDGLFKDKTDISVEIKNIASEIKAFLDKTMYFTGENSADIITYFIIHSYFKDHFRYAPRLIIEGASSSGKSRLNMIISSLSYHGVYYCDSSYASCFRDIDELDVTPVLSEYGDYDKSNQADMNRLLVNGFEKLGVFSRYNQNRNKTEHYNIFTPITIDVKSYSGFREDITNRSIHILMVENYDKELVDVDAKELEAITTKLYRLKLVEHLQSIRDRERKKIFDFDQYSKDCAKILDSKDKGGFLIPSEGSGIRPYTPAIRNRPLDIATTYYPFARLTDTVDSLMNELAIIQEMSVEKMRSTFPGMIFNVWLSNIPIKDDDTTDSFIERAIDIPVQTIKEQYIDLLRKRGDYTGEAITTYRVTSALESLGFKTEYKHKKEHKTRVDNTKNLKELLSANIRKFCDDDLKEKLISIGFTKPMRSVPASENEPFCGKMEVVL